jgi:predicted NBD/HSP70 family sugar kinase
VGTDRVTPGSQTSLREANRARIVSAVQQRGSLTQVELAGVTGLSPATVSNIVKELTAAGVLHTAPTSRSGRRAQQVTLARNLGLVAGMHFDTRSLRVALSDVAHRIVAEQRMPLPPDHRADAGLERAVLLLTEMVESVDASLQEVLAVGVGVPAPVDITTGLVSTVGILRGWDGVVVPEVLEQRLGIPVYVDNDVNLGALAEVRLGAARGRRDVVYLRVSYGVGGGLGIAGEVGHLTMDDDGPLCRCGNRGCLETYIGGPALLAMLQPSHGHLTLRDMITRAESGDPVCRRVIADAGTQLGRAAANVCNLFDPELVVVGGQLAEAGALLLDPLRTVLAQRVVPSTAGPVDVVAGELGASPARSR